MIKGKNVSLLLIKTTKQVDKEVGSWQCATLNTLRKTVSLTLVIDFLESHSLGQVIMSPLKP